MILSVARVAEEKNHAWLQLSMMQAKSLNVSVLKRLYLHLRRSWIWHNPSQTVCLYASAFRREKRYASCPACDTLLALGSSNVSASQGSSCALLPQSLSFMLWSVPSSHVVQLATLPI
jgi:hypothetical protein